jgi:hypothetical protein
MNMTWTAEQTRLMAHAWRGGESAARIGALVGMTAAAVRGKRLRLGLPPRSPVSIAEAFRERGASLVGLGREPPPGRPEAVSAPLYGSTPRPWVQRMDGECCWPVAGWGDETLSCCLPVDGRSAYCTGHLALLRREPWPPIDPERIRLLERMAWVRSCRRRPYGYA